MMVAGVGEGGPNTFLGRLLVALLSFLTLLCCKSKQRETSAPFILDFEFPKIFAPIFGHFHLHL